MPIGRQRTLPRLTPPQQCRRIVVGGTLQYFSLPSESPSATILRLIAKPRSARADDMVP